MSEGDRRLYYARMTVCRRGKKEGSEEQTKRDGPPSDVEGVMARHGVGNTQTLHSENFPRKIPPAT